MLVFNNKTVIPTLFLYLFSIYFIFYGFHKKLKNNNKDPKVCQKNSKFLMINLFNLPISNYFVK